MLRVSPGELVFSAQGLAETLLNAGKGESAISKIGYHLVGRAALVTASLAALAEAVTRAVVGSLTLLIHFVTLGLFQEIKMFGLKEIQKGADASSISFNCLLSLISPQRLLDYLTPVKTIESQDNKSKKGKTIIEESPHLPIPLVSPLKLETEKTPATSINSVSDRRGLEVNYQKSSPTMSRESNETEADGWVVQDDDGEFSLSDDEEFDYQPENLTPLMRSQRLRRGPKNIERRLLKHFERAQDQAAKEADKKFRYLSAPADFKGKREIEKVPGYEVGVSHFIGRRKEMEDQHLATSFDLNVDGKIYPIQLFGVLDGHGGGQASLYLKNNLAKKLKETLEEFCSRGMSHENIWNALKQTFVRLKREFKEPKSGSTATVAMIFNQEELWTANVGDSRTILDSGIQLSEDAKPTDIYYKQKIENRGGKVINGRINRQLAVARAIGDHNVGAVSARPKITVYPLAQIPKGGHLILACDGIYDVSSTRQIAKGVQEHREESAAQIASDLVYSAYQAFSLDNLSALVVKFV